MNIVLLEPEIPFNTGAIGRTCVAANACLHLIRPYGFMINEKSLKRAGLDYWDKLRLKEYNNYEDFLKNNPGLNTKPYPKLWYATTKAEQSYSDVKYGAEDYIMFGKETAGIPEEILSINKDTCIRIPMHEEERSLNLSNAAAIILYEALRQNDFAGLEKSGKLHRLSWKNQLLKKL